ncbi:MAG: ATP phosphoribosyltransferase regulatory subunit [Pseudomonadota bacterium]
MAGAGAAVAQQTFRLMDPISQRMMGLRADMTPQVARIAASRLAKAPRPLRLCYAGQVLRVRGGQLRAARQFGQVGAELIGAGHLLADVEVVSLAAEALQGLGIEALSVDLTQPTLVSDLARDLGFAPESVALLREALDRKDAATVQAAAGEKAGIFIALLRAAGPAERGLRALKSLSLPKPVAAQVGQLAEVVALIAEALPGLAITIDPVEHRGFEYQTGLSFTFFAPKVRGELGRGGRYRASSVGQGKEPATGFTLYMDTIMGALPPGERRPRVYLAPDAGRTRARALQAEGWVTLGATDPAADHWAEAKRLGCGHILSGEELEEL